MREKSAHIRLVYILIPFVLLLMAWQIHPGGDGHTTPYLFEMPGNLLPPQSPTDNPITMEGVALGRKLFYDPILSGNGKQSCAGCHKQELAFTDGKAISIGSRGLKAKRNSMALVNLGWQDRYFWDGRAQTLERLIHFPVTDSLEMNASITDVEKRLNADTSYQRLFKSAFDVREISMPLVEMALSQFLRTIVSYKAPFDLIYQDYVSHGNPDVSDLQLVLNGFDKGNESLYGEDSSLIKRIREVSADTKVLTVFSKCIDCHYNSLQLFCKQCETAKLPVSAKTKFKNNGLEVEGADKGLYSQTGKEKDKYLFKVPTLRNLSFTAPYMHDGRFKTLEEVVEHYNSGIEPNPNLDTLLMDSSGKPIRFGLNEQEKKQLVGLLKLFTDSSVVTDMRFSEPGHRFQP